MNTTKSFCTRCRITLTKKETEILANGHPVCCGCATWMLDHLIKCYLDNSCEVTHPNNKRPQQSLSERLDIPIP